MKNCKRCTYFLPCLRRGDVVVCGDVCQLYKEETIGARFRELSDDKIAHFLWQVQAGLRSSASEEAWLTWLKSIYEEEQNDLY